MFFLGVPTTSNILCSHSVIFIPALTNASSKISKGLLPILHPPLPTNFTFPYLINPNGMSKIDALNFFAKSSVRSKKSFDFAIADFANVSIEAMSLMFGLLTSSTALFTQRFAATIGNAAFLLHEIVTSPLRFGEYWIWNMINDETIKRKNVETM